MKMRGTAAATPEEWLALWSGWPRECAEALRHAVAAGAAFEQRIKWGNLMFAHRGLCVLIHVEENRVVLGFFRGKRLRDLDPAIKASGKYELGNITFRPGDAVDAARIGGLARAAAALNAELGDPTSRS
ncbi:MAG: DUF1801 domain-containing protein [Novosphingobium sp.]